MIDHVVVIAPRGARVDERRLAGGRPVGRPSAAYSQGTRVVSKGIPLTIKWPRRDGEGGGTAPFKLSFNGFDAGSYSAASAAIDEVLEVGSAVDFVLDAVEASIDIHAYPAYFWSSLSLHRAALLQRWEDRSQVLHQRLGSRDATVAWGKPSSRQLKIYDKALELTKRHRVDATALRAFLPWTRIEVRFGRGFQPFQRVTWREIPGWLSKSNPFEAARWSSADFDHPSIDRLSLEGFLRRGFLHVVRDELVPFPHVFRALRVGRPWERRLCKSLLALETKKGRPPFERMFEISASRFFETRDGPMPGLLWSHDGTSFVEVPHQVIRPADGRRRRSTEGA